MKTELLLFIALLSAIISLVILYYIIKGAVAAGNKELVRVNRMTAFLLAGKITSESGPGIVDTAKEQLSERDGISIHNNLGENERQKQLERFVV